jgi:Alr-MurF fusion protein
MLFSQLGKIIKGQVAQLAKDRLLERYLTDSRKMTAAETSCFFAIQGTRHDGHRFIADLYQNGVRQFVVEKELIYAQFPEANFFITISSLEALQRIATQHRQQFNYPVIGITGSNGKTIIKEWLFQLLAPDLHIVKNPGSYNSQLGVPLAVLQMRAHHQLGIFEAGISRTGEMEKLATIIQPTIGIFTNVGTAHDEGFKDRQQKVAEKLKLFAGADEVIYCRDYADLHGIVSLTKVKRLDWGRSKESTFPVAIAGNHLQVLFQDKSHSFALPFSDEASVENLIHCVVFLLHQGKSPTVIQDRIRHLKSVPMRLEMKQGINQCQLIDDSYNNDLAGLQISINFLSSQQKKNKTLILSDILQSGMEGEELMKSTAAILRGAGIHKLIGVGLQLERYSRDFDFIPNCHFFPSTEELLKSYPFDQFQNEVILLKGARVFQFEKVVQRLQKKIHGTVMEVDLNAMVHNLNYFKSLLQPGVKLMVMVKAFAYGSGSEEVANLLQYHKVDYLGVAYADEGVDLRKNQISLPIMVMNPSEESFSTLLDFRLEPEIYSLNILNALISFLQGRPCGIHLKLDTGMHRLGFEEEEVDEVAGVLKQNPNLEVISVFTHLAGTDEQKHDIFSRQQVEAYQRMYVKLANIEGRNPLRHVLNSPGILRFPDFQFDMVRLGIGLYGVNPTEQNVDELKPVATLKTVISQIKKIPAGESIGYGRRGVAQQNMTLATIAIGYADGFSRSFSRGVGKVLVHGKKVPVVGNVCMDMTMIDVTGLEAKEGDEVIIFGKGLPIHEVAESIQTIPYEILTNTSERVKRVFFAEGI